MIYDRNWRSVERDRQLLVHVNNEPVKNSFSKIEQRSEEKNNFSSDFEFAEILFNILIKKKGIRGVSFNAIFSSRTFFVISRTAIYIFAFTSFFLDSTKIKSMK